MAKPTYKKRCKVSELNDQGTKLLTLLADGEFHSGEVIGQQLGVSRTSVNNYIKALREIGIDIYNVTGRGYRCVEPIELLNKMVIQSQSNHANVKVDQILDSTNQWLIDNINNIESGQVCIAEYQLAGRGRRGRKWVSPFASHLYFSYYNAFNVSLDQLSGVSLLVGLVCVNALEKLSVEGLKLKWPNDIYYQNKKLAGILIETAPSTRDQTKVIIGIGINVKMPPDQAKLIDQPWIDLNSVTTGKIDRNQLSALLIKELDTLLPKFEKEGLSPFIDQWFKYDNFLNQPVSLIIGEQIEPGICKGINQHGALLLEQNGKIIPFIGGEISLRASKQPLLHSF
ncbi:MAG TPA: bifunctional biotin--[acetyl-CoA-carboxylase] ligase/biotin operon repressor BirA [Psychromonas hadalis]|nr:bifunctional biotin--[acetyl-CoA-carboxylase] ligase/biotin operon repressor BirA [Psychromonas hadalis]